MTAGLQAATIATDRGVDVEVLSGGTGPDLVWFHGLVGLGHTEPVLHRLAERFTVHAPTWPGYGELANEGSVEDMLDFALLGWDIVDALGLSSGESKPHLVGHSFGAMIAAEMATLARHDLDRLALVAPFGLWLDDQPIPDPFAVTPFALTDLLFADPANAALLLPPDGGLDSDEGLAGFMIANTRRLGTAGKIMFPIPNRRLSKRLYRVTAPTGVFLGADDLLITEPYGRAWAEAVDGASVQSIEGAGHMVNLEQPGALADALAAFLA